METPGTDHRIKATGFSKIVDVAGRDSAEVYVILQKRWEDENGNVYAKRIGTAIERLSENTPDWKNNHRLNILYGDPANQPGSKSYMQLIPKEQSLYCINSKGKSVPVEEVG